MLSDAVLEFFGHSVPGVGDRSAESMADQRDDRGAGIDERPATDAARTGTGIP